MLAASRALRASRMVVGICINDIGGSKAAVTKAVELARPGDSIVAVHVTKMVPELLLTSAHDIDAVAEPRAVEASRSAMPFSPEQFLTSSSDLNDLEDEPFGSMVSELPLRSGAELQEFIKGFADKQMEAAGKQVDLEVKGTSPSSDIKQGLLNVAGAEGADLLLVGPGSAGNGKVPPFLAMRAKRLTVCVVRDALVE